MQDKYFVPLMKKISEEIDRKAMKKLKKYRLTLTQGRVILFLAERMDKRATQKELEEYLQVSHPTTVTIVKSMEAKNIVKTSQDDRDRRMKNVTLIWGDEDIYQELRENAQSMEIGLLEGFSEEEQRQFYSYLKRIYQNAVMR